MLRSIVVLCLFTPVALSQTPLAVEIRLGQAKVGLKYTVRNVNATMSEFVATVNGVREEKTEKRSAKYTYIDQILEQPDADKPATRLTRTYTMAEQNVDGKKETAPFVGKSATIELKAGKYAFTVDGKPADEELIKWLERDFVTTAVTKEKIKDEEILPTQAVKVGESWAINMKQFLKENSRDLPIDLNKDGNTGKGKLVKTYTQDGAMWGTILLTIKLSPSAIRSDTPIPLRKGGQFNLAMTIDAPIDGSQMAGTRVSKTKAELEVLQPGQQLKVTISGTSSRTVTVEK